MGLHQDDAYNTQYGETLCECCYSDLYVTTDDGDEIPRGDAVEVKTMGNGGRIYWTWVHMDNAVECVDGNFWHEDDVIFSEITEEYVPASLVADYPEHFEQEEEETEEAA